MVTTTAMIKTAKALPPAAPTPKPARIKIGDSVYLNSGSEKMCITSVRRDGFVICMWFDEKRSTMRRAAFPPAALCLDEAEIGCEIMQ